MVSQPLPGFNGSMTTGQILHENHFVNFVEVKQVIIQYLDMGVSI
jgi:hypothetical protein